MNFSCDERTSPSVQFAPTETLPLTLPSPARGEGEHIEIVKKFPPPRRGRARVGVILGNFSNLRGGKGGGDVLNIFLQRLGSGRPFSLDNLPVAGEETKMALIR